MAKKIKSTDIFQGDIFAKQQKSAKEFIKVLNNLETELKDILKINKAIIDQASQEAKTTETLKKRALATKQVKDASIGLQKVEQERQRTLQSLEKTEQQRERTSQNKLRTEKQIRIEEERQIKIKAKKLQQLKKEQSAYSKLTKQLATMRARYKDLASSEKQNTTEAKKLLSAITKLDGKIKSIDKSVGQSQRNVGNYGSAFSKLGGTLRNVAGAFGLVGGVMGAVRVIKGAFNVVANFDEAIANLGAISGATGVQLELLTDSALELGETTRFTATEVAGLQLELAKLGFSTTEILQSTESILALASATGTELADASKIAGSTLRAFNLDASEMDRVTSVLGVATTKTGLNMEFLGVAMSKVAPVSSALGFSIEDTTALLGTLANAGFDASTSATATRNILLNLADSSGDLATQLGRPVKNLDELVPALQELNDKGINLAESLELTDKRSVSAFNTFLNGTGTMIALRDSITDVSAELQAMSDKQLNTINGQLALLNSKWQGLLLGASESSGAVEKIKNSIKFLTDNLSAILSVISKVVKWFVIYKTTIIATNLVMGIYNAVIVTAKFVSIAFSRGLGVATRSMKMFNIATKSNPIGLFAGLVATAIASLDLFNDSVEQTSANLDILTDSYQKLRDQQKQTFQGIDADSKQRIAEIDLEIAKLEQANGSEERIAELKSERLDQEIADIQKKSKILTEQIAKDQETISQEGSNISDIIFGVSATSGFNLTSEQLAERNRIIAEGRKEAVKLAMEQQSLDVDELKNLQTQLKLSMTQNETKRVGLNLDKKTTKSNNKARSVRNIFEKELNKILKVRRQIVENIRKEELDAEIDIVDKKIEEELRLKNEQTQDVDFVNEGNLASLEKYQELLNEKQILDNQQIAKSTEFVIKGEEKKQELYLQTLKKSVKDKKLTQKEADILIINSEKNLQKQIDFLRIEENEKYKDIQQDKVDAYKDANQEIIDSTNETIEKIESENEKTLKADKELLSKRLSAFQEFTNQIISLIDKQTDKKIDAINKELSESEKREDELRKLAQKGTTTANQSLASEQKRQAELERQKAELEKKKLRRQAIVSGLELLSNKLDNDEPDAVTSTIRDITSLIGILSTLPAFKDGSEFVTDSNSPKGRDKIIARIDQGERILTRDQNKDIGDLSNTELTSLAKSYNDGLFNDVNYLNPKIATLNTPFQDSTQILNKFDELKRTIENKPMLTEIRWNEITSMIIEKVETKNTIIRNHQSSKSIF